MSEIPADTEHQKNYILPKYRKFSHLKSDSEKDFSQRQNGKERTECIHQVAAHVTALPVI